MSIPAITFRGIRKKLIKTTLAELDVDITPLHFEIISLLNEEGTMYVAEIGRRLYIAKAQMTQLIDKLVSCDMVEKKTNPDDRRTATVTLTKNGKSFLEDRSRKFIGDVTEAVSCLTDEELVQLAASLENLREILSRLLSERERPD